MIVGAVIGFCSVSPTAAQGPAGRFRECVSWGRVVVALLLCTPACEIGDRIRALTYGGKFSGRWRHHRRTGSCVWSDGRNWSEESLPDLLGGDGAAALVAAASIRRHRSPQRGGVVPPEVYRARVPPGGLAHGFVRV